MHTTAVSLLDDLRTRPDGPAWQRFAEVYQPWLRGWLRSQGLQPADVDDLVQDVLAVLVRELPNFRHNGRKGAFRTWLRGITVNCLRQQWRARRRVPEPGGRGFEETLNQLADPRSPLTQVWERDHDQHLVRQLLQRVAADFEPRTWQAFRGFMLEGRGAAAVAAELGMSEGAVWTAKSHVLKRLRTVGRDLLD